MPHGSGGGFHSGGFHSSSYSSNDHGHRRYDGPITVTHPHVGYSRYRFRRWNTYEYIYVKDRAYEPDFGLIIELTIALLLLELIWLLTILQRPTISPIDPSSYDSTIVIEDTIDVLTDAEEEKLRSAFESFRTKTGIACAFVTETNETWNTNYKNLEKYAYDVYVNRWDDEKHWLFVYTQPETPDSDFVYWYWEGMQGNDTDVLLPSNVTTAFDKTVQTYLESDDCSVGNAFSNAIRELTNTIQVEGGKYKTSEIAFVIALMIATVAICVCVIRKGLKRFEREQAEINKLHASGIKAKK